MLIPIQKPHGRRWSSDPSEQIMDQNPFPIHLLGDGKENNSIMLVNNQKKLYVSIIFPGKKGNLQIKGGKYNIITHISWDWHIFLFKIGR